MKTLLKIISFIGLAFTVVPSFFVFYGVLPINVHYNFMLAGMIMWFGTAPFWVKHEN